MTTVYDKNTISAKHGDQVVSCVTECLQKLMVHPPACSFSRPCIIHFLCHFSSIWPISPISDEKGVFALNRNVKTFNYT